ncbi:site-specific DNA-methyltransferase [Dehalobacter sp. 14DCB1]|uniref:site-specific DNA-methyltransferase n=1 Tax=Dehalobacter sp. 14DCB1 TaxID=2070227 RepID=UPI0010474F60|nr:site-specific DNA-methyltransferase [Dehalobacter sp. 14DCB1]TCX53599.1 site-specific DNA-methyltransferase [Dehalobacter sp. 14DCB1]
MKKQGKLELTWVGKYDERIVEPRILVEDKLKSYGDHDTGNMLIHGDNLIALKALEQDFTEKIKCVYIDPPYNTGNAFDYYEDGLEHSLWLNLMYNRLEILKNLLSEDGTIWISVDDSEVHYLKVMCDEVFGRDNFLADIAYERSGSAGIGQGGAFLVNTHEFILVYAKNKTKLSSVEAKVYKPLDKEVMKRYSKVLKNEGEKELVSEFIAPGNGETVKIYKHNNYDIETISLKDFTKRESEIRCSYLEQFENIFRTTNPQKENSFQQKIINQIDGSLHSVEYIPSRGQFSGQQTTLYYLNNELFAWLKASAEVIDNEVVKTNKMTGFWRNEDIPKANLANEGGVDFKRGKKPEVLLYTILSMVTKKGDYVLDSFLGSGTTAAVAHKMGRKWIGIELGDHCISHCLPRLQATIDNSELSGISNKVNWNGGGGFKFYELADSLLVKNSKLPVYEINPSYTFEMMVEAICKIEGFRYKCIGEFHGMSSENRFIHVTNEFVNSSYILSITKNLDKKQSLLIYCKKNQSSMNLPENVEIKKIPKDLLAKCSFESEEL